jgi:hypothetical protein
MTSVLWTVNLEKWTLELEGVGIIDVMEHDSPIRETE